MSTRQVNPRRVKVHRSYSVQELAARFDVHRNTVRNWQRQGLAPVDDIRPTIFLGTEVRRFLSERTASRKRPCPPGTFYCFRCRMPRPPAGDMIDYLPIREESGNLRAICAECETLMHRRVRFAQISNVMPGCAVQIVHREPSLSLRSAPSLDCDQERCS